MKKWTVKEVEYLEDYWGKSSITNISNHLNRSISSVKEKAYKLGLGNHLDASAEITLNKLFKAIFKRNIDSYRLGQWVRAGFKIKYKVSITKKYKVVDIDYFWKWAEKNQKLMYFYDFEENLLGKEPKWVKIKRKNDIMLHNKFTQKPWTKNEDDKLKKYINEYKYSFKELSEMLGRTEGAIQRRLNDLCIKGRPLKADNHKKWTKEEYMLLGEMLKNRTDYRIISDKLGKSVKAIRGRVYDMYLTENIDKVADMIGDGKWGDNRPPRPITSRLNNAEEKKKIKSDLNEFVGILKGVIKNKYDNDDFWQKDICMNWNGYICTKNQLSCDICTEFRRIKPQYCRRCGETIIDRKKKDMCDKCKTQRKKQYQRKYMALKNINNEEIN